MYQPVNSLHISTQVTGNNVGLEIEDQVESVHERKTEEKQDD